MRLRTAACLLLAAALPTLAADWGQAEYAGLINDPALDEVSGLAASHAHPGLLWMHNDGGNGAELHLVADDGTLRATYTAIGVGNTDWEDLAAFERDGKRYVAVADTGDNGGLRKTLSVHVFEEPAQAADGELTPAWSIAFRWPDGPRDCEAMAVDAARGEILLISKKRVPPELFRLPLRPVEDGVQVAEKLGSLAGVEQPTQRDLARNPIYGRYRAQITGADVSPDGRELAVLNYRTALIYRRSGNQDWGAAIDAAPSVVSYPWLPQAEAIGYGLDGRSLFIASEKRPTPLLRIPRQP